jgi:hypothetical protein
LAKQIIYFLKQVEKKNVMNWLNKSKRRTKEDRRK